MRRAAVLLVMLLAAMRAACGREAPKSQLTDLTGADFGRELRLTDHTGKPRTLADFKGKVVVIFFGFTHCPDVCPTALAELANAAKELGKDAGRMQVLFVTVDPERDTPEKLKDYVSSFHPRVFGLTGTPAEIEAVTRAYRAYAKKVPLDGGGYTMDHSAIVYLMDKDGRFVAPFNLKRSAEQAAADLKRRL